MTGEPERWPARAGPWLGIGASPAALVLGVGLAVRHDGAVPLWPVLVGAALMAAILASQGMLGLASPHGEGTTLTALAPSYLRRWSHRLLSGVLAAAMVGWFGFNVGLGGAALAALLGLPDPLGAVLLGTPVWLLSAGGIRRWNTIAIGATLAALLLGAVVGVLLAAPVSPVVAEAGAPSLALADVAGFVGYVAVFGVRAPDFSVGLGRRRDLAVCVALLVGSFLVMTTLGALVHRGTGSTDLVETLAGPGGLAIGNLLVAAAVIGPSFTTTYSGSLALRSLVPWSERGAISAIAIPGLALAVLRFDRLLLPWLSLLAAVLPALVVPMGVEAHRRRQGRPARLVPVWTWAPASAVAVAVTVVGGPAATLLSLLLAGIATAVWASTSPTDREAEHVHQLPPRAAR